MKPATCLRRLSAFVLMLCLAGPVSAGTPELRAVGPVAAQRGTDIEVTLHGNRLNDVSEVLFHTQGITPGELTFENNKVHTTFKIAADAPPGEHLLRVVTRSGVTEAISFHVVDRPIVRELSEEEKKRQDSTSPDQPQPVQLGTVVLGRTLPEDVDYFGVELKRGQRLTAQLDGMRLGKGFTDSYIEVRGPDNAKLASCDDTPLLRQDPFVSLVAPKDGRYTIMIRDSGYEGGNDNWYLLHVGSFVRPAFVYPLGGMLGEKTQLRFIGDAAGVFTQTVTLPKQANNDYTVMPERDGQRPPSGHAFRVNGLPNVMEDPAVDNSAMKQMEGAETHSVPVALNGVIEEPGDVDYFKVQLRKGQAVRMRCFASSMGSRLDAVMNIYSVKDNKHLQGNDDQGGLDSIIEFNPPEDGEYYVRVRDHRKRGGAEYVYRVEVVVPRPFISTRIERYDQNNPQRNQGVAVPAGNRVATLVRVSQRGVKGDTRPELEGLPEGVRVVGKGPSGAGVIPVVFEAGGQAELGARLVDFSASGAGEGDSAERVSGSMRHVIPLVMANPNRTEYYQTTLDRMPVAVTEAVPFKIDVVQPKAPLVKDGRMKLKVNLTRGEGYEKNVRLYMLWKPQGVGATGQVFLGKGKTEGEFDIDANGSAGTRDWPMVVVAQCDTDLGPVWVSSQLFNVKIEDPFVTGTIQKASVTRGQQIDVVVDIEHPRDWQGEGELKLLGMPKGCTFEPIKIKPGQESATFKVKTADDAQPGTHRSLMCELTIQVNGEPVVHRFARGGQLRIDKVRKPKNTQARAEGGE